MMKTKVVASECCAGLFPQNTLRGFQHCLDSGADAIEFDVHLSLDGQVVVQHDYRLNPAITRDASGRWLAKPGPPLCRLTSDDLKSYDVGRYAPGTREARSYPDYQPCDGQSVPLFGDFLDLHRQCKASSELWVELKTSPFERGISSDPDALLDAVLSSIRQAGLESRVVLLAFEWNLLVSAIRQCADLQTNFLSINPEFVKAIHKKSGAVNPAILFGDFNPDQHGKTIAGAITKAGGHWWGPYVSDVTKKEVLEAQQLGLRVNLWGVDSTDKAMDHALSMEADAITLARPDLLHEKIQTAGGRAIERILKAKLEEEQ
jgi:glycerophosphoryl diester phosphodiesterase